MSYTPINYADKFDGNSVLMQPNSMTRPPMDDDPAEIWREPRAPEGNAAGCVIVIAGVLVGVALAALVGVVW